MVSVCVERVKELNQLTQIAVRVRAAAGARGDGVGVWLPRGSFVLTSFISRSVFRRVRIDHLRPIDFPHKVIAHSGYVWRFAVVLCGETD